MATLDVLARLFALLLLFRAIGLPLARLALPGMVASSYALAPLVGFILAGHVTWLLLHAGLALDASTIGIGLGVTLASSALAAVTLRRRGQPAFATAGREVVTHHLVALLGFSFALAITARNPSVDPDSERFMDLAMVNAVVSSRSLPLEDPWLAGERVSYYDYGYYATGYLALATGVEPARLFPVAVALAWAALLVGTFALGRDLGGFAVGFGAAYLVAVAGNLDALWQTLGGAASLEWFQSARVIHGGVITEFPFFALLWGDLHPYAMALPLWPLLLALGFTLATGGTGVATTAVGGVTFAALLATHTWDAVPIFVVLMLAPLVVRGGAGGGRAALLLLVAGIVLAIPYLVSAPTAGRGLALVTDRSTLRELFTQWGAPVVVLAFASLAPLTRLANRAEAPMAMLAIGALVVSLGDPALAIPLVLTIGALALAGFAETSVERYGWLLSAIGLGLVFGVELLFLDDVYTGDLERMNSVFKAYVEAWVLLGLGSVVAVSATAKRMAAGGRAGAVVLAGVTLVVVVSTALYPLRAIPARSGDLLAPYPLDARYAFQRLYPDDAAVVAELATLPRGVVLEATGGPYEWDARVATFTGFPAVVGWGHHEAGWRNSWDLVRPRVDDVGYAYAAPDLGNAMPILEQYRVRYVMVGVLERSRYEPDALAKFDALHTVARSGASRVFEVRDPDVP